VTDLHTDLQSLRDIAEQLGLAQCFIESLRQELKAARARCKPGYAATVAVRLHDELRELYLQAAPTIERQAAVRALTAVNETFPDMRAWRDREPAIGPSELDATRTELAALKRMRPIAELHEDDGPVLLWRASVPVTVGSVLDEDFMDTVDYREITHWSQLPLPQLEAYTWDLEEAGI
jgi:hypothetical protein